MIVRQVQNSDASAIAELYNWYIGNTVISFEETPVSKEDIIQRLGRVDDSNPWLVLEDAGELLGYAYAIPFKSRPSYRYTRESSVYIHKDHTGQGYGLKLMQSLIDEIRVMPIHVLIAGIALPNEASVKLHESLALKRSDNSRKLLRNSTSLSMLDTGDKNYELKTAFPESDNPSGY